MSYNDDDFNKMTNFFENHPIDTITPSTPDYKKNMNFAIRNKKDNTHSRYWRNHREISDLVMKYNTQKELETTVRNKRTNERNEYKAGPDAYLERKYNEFINLRPDDQLINLNELLDNSLHVYKNGELINTLTKLGEIYDKSPSIFSVFSSKKPTKEEIKKLVTDFYKANKTAIDEKMRDFPQSIKDIFTEVKKEAEDAIEKERDVAALPVDTVSGDDVIDIADVDLDDSGEEKQDESIKINLQTMLTKLPPYDVNKKEEQYREEYIAKNNKDGELFTYEEEKEGGVHSVGGRTQKKKKKRVQNRRRQKTIKNKV